MNVLPQLLSWQKEQSRKEGVEGYLVLPYKTLRLLAQELPQTQEELLNVKGIGPRKAQRYGKDLLALCAGETQEISGVYDFSEEDAHQSTEVVSGAGESPDQLEHMGEEVVTDADIKELSVQEFVTQLNTVVSSYFRDVRVRGEVIGFKRNANGHAYFEIKDAGAVLRCSVFRGAYEMSGVELYDGAEVIITGSPQLHDRYGFSFIGERVELAGEGALKKAYDDLKKKLTDEGLFSADRKREVSELPERVGLITSATGAAIGDFMTNVGSFGYRISFVSTHVEGSKAVPEIMKAIATLRAQEVDVLVIVRGGGSLESLQAFNNERVVRALADFPAPVIAGVGHEQDETLTTLVADVGVSTPTAAARAVRVSWDQAVEKVSRFEQTFREYCTYAVQTQAQSIDRYQSMIEMSYQQALTTQCHQLERSMSVLTTSGQQLIATCRARCDLLEQRIMTQSERWLSDIRHQIHRQSQSIIAGYGRVMQTYRQIFIRFERVLPLLQRAINHTKKQVAQSAHTLVQLDPRKLLAQGYSIAYDKEGRVLRSVKDIEPHADLTIQLSDGTIATKTK